MGTSKKYIGPSGRQSGRMEVKTSGVQGALSFGSLGDVNWTGAKKVFDIALQNGDAYIGKIIKSLFLKKEVLDVFISSLDPGLAIFVDVAFAVYGIETSSNGFIIKIKERIETFNSIFEVFNRIRNVYCPNPSRKDESALNESIIAFMNKVYVDIVEQKHDIGNISDKFRQEQIRQFIADYIDKQIMVYLAYKLEDSTLDVNEIEVLRNKSKNYIMGYLSDYSELSLSIEILKDIIKKTMESIIKEK